MARFVGRDNVCKRLAPLDGEPGRTTYSDGAVRIETPGEVIVVRPPFGLVHEGEYESVQLEPWRTRAEFTALGGDRAAIDRVLGASPELGWLSEKALPRFFAVPDPRQAVLERLPYEFYAAEMSIDRS